MSYIIDGHNLIGILPDIELSQPDDEQRLLARLRSYRARIGGRGMIVFFDSGPAALAPQTAPTGPAADSPGVEVRYARPGQTADDAIIAHLSASRQPGQYAVVTNDQELAGRARAAGASVLSATEFAAQMARSVTRRRERAAPEATPAPDPHDPGFADIYADFLAAEKAGERFSGKKQADAATWIERLYTADPQLAEQAAAWLGRFGGAAALDPLRDAVTHKDAGVRAAALLALGALGNPTALPVLCDRLAHDGNSMVREAAAQSLGRIGDRSVLAALAEAAAHDAKGKVRKAAAAAHAQISARSGMKKGV